jgi:hypothetical protein
LIRLRQALIASAQQYPCFDTVDKNNKNASSDSLKIDFIVEKDVDPNIGFNIYIVTVKAGYDNDTKNTNSINLTFAPVVPKKK